MRKPLSRLLGSILVLSLVVLSVASLASRAFAGQLTAASVSLSSVVSTDSSAHTITFKVASTTAVRKVKFEYIVAPSGAGSSTVPESLFTTSAAKGSTISVDGTNEPGSWTVTSSVDGTILYERSSDTATLTAGDEFIFQTTGLQNNTASPAGSACDTVANSETCYVRITTLTAADATIDTAITSYTVITGITVSATVDPVLRFTVTAVTSGNAATNDAGLGTCTAVTTTATTVPFSNVSVATPKCGQHALTVMTNAQTGYTVYSKFTSSDIMAGSYSGNNIDGFSGNSAGWPDDSGTPGSWASPTGSTKNINTGWLGIRTTNANISGFTADKWAPASNAAGSGKRVMTSTGPDLGTTATYVTYKFEVNALQPADAYSGSAVYNVVASF